MMTSDEKRREVSLLLREEFGQGQCQWSDLFRDMLAEILKCNGTLDGAPLYDQMAEKLADLIDRPTCNDAGDDWTFRCSACGCELDIRDMEAGEPTMWKDGAAQVPKYCPSCGAEVVSND